MKSPVVAVLAITGGNILGPLFIFGGVGYALTKVYNNTTFVLVGIGISFVLSNIMILTTTQKLLKSFIKK